MTVQYVDYDTVVAINAEHCGHGAGVRDEDGIRAQLGRLEQSFLGEELYPTIALKAAVLLHGISSTQYFHDGNKRTAWIVANLFLELNDAPLKKLPVVAAEAFVLAIATSAFENDEEGHERAVSKAADWVTQHRFRMRDRLDYAIVAQDAASTPEHTFNAAGGQLGGVFSPQFPVFFTAAVIVRMHFLREDAYRSWTLRAECSTQGVARLLAPNARVRDHFDQFGGFPDDFDPNRDTVSHDEGIALAFEDLTGRHPTGVIPSLTVIPVGLVLEGPGTAEIVLTVNGQFLAKRLLQVDRLPDFDPSTLEAGLRMLVPGS